MDETTAMGVGETQGGGALVRVLIVDDDPDMRASLRDLLEFEGGYEAAVASDLEEALERLEAFAPDIALVDIKLGLENGLDLMPVLKTRDRQLSCVVMTAHRDVRYAATAVRRGADDYLFKPLDPEELFAVLRRLAGRLTVLREKQEAERRFRAVFEGTAEAVVVLDARNRIVDVNRAFGKLTGYARDEVLGESSDLLRSPRYDPEFYGQMLRVLEHADLWRGEYWVRRKGGEEFPCWISISAVRDARGGIRHYVVLFSDITLMKQAEHNLRSIAFNDPLTGLPNRARFEERLELAVSTAARHGRRMALLFVDLDGFKAVNDRLGHEAGDRLLIDVGRRLKNAVRGEDTAFRLSGDEFTVILGEIHEPENVEHAATRVVETLSAPFDLEGHQAFISASVGVALYPDGGEVPDALVRHADEAMYAAKKSGKNRYCFYVPREGADD